MFLQRGLFVLIRIITNYQLTTYQGTGSFSVLEAEVKMQLLLHEFLIYTSSFIVLFTCARSITLFVFVYFPLGAFNQILSYLLISRVKDTYYKCEGSILQGKRHSLTEYVYVQQIYIIQRSPEDKKKVLDSSSETWTFATTFSVTLCTTDPAPPLRSLPRVKKEGKGF